MYISYDLVKAIQRERVSRAMSQFEARRVPVPEFPAPSAGEDADIIELVFSSHCETDQIGA